MTLENSISFPPTHVAPRSFTPGFSFSSFGQNIIVNVMGNGHVGADEGDRFHVLFGDVFGEDRRKSKETANRTETVLVEIGRTQRERSGAREDGRYLGCLWPTAESALSHGSRRPPMITTQPAPTSSLAFWATTLGVSRIVSDDQLDLSPMSPPAALTLSIAICAAGVQYWATPAKGPLREEIYPILIVPLPEAALSGLLEQPIITSDNATKTITEKVETENLRICSPFVLNGVLFAYHGVLRALVVNSKKERPFCQAFNRNQAAAHRFPGNRPAARASAFGNPTDSIDHMAPFPSTYTERPSPT